MRKRSRKSKTTKPVGEGAVRELANESRGRDRGLRDATRLPGCSAGWQAASGLRLPAGGQLATLRDPRVQWPANADD